MLEFLNAIRVGAVSLFGVAIPGFLLLFFAYVGILAPVCVCVLVVFGGDVALLAEISEAYHWQIVATFIIFSYVTGFVLRLTSPDRLDEVSGEQVLRRMTEKERENWPYTGKDNKDKFPYLNLPRYLEKRRLGHLLDFKKWVNDDAVSESQPIQRSKTAVHAMKLTIRTASSELAAQMDSNEAHIRLMSGTWIAIKQTRRLLPWGFGSCILVGGVGIVSRIRSDGRWSFDHDLQDLAPYLLTYAAMVALLFFAMTWARQTIERLFHYRRVNELVWIVMAAEAARKLER